MTRPRRGRLRVVEIEAKRPTTTVSIAIVGAADGMTDRAASALDELIALGRAVDARPRRVRRSGP